MTEQCTVMWDNTGLMNKTLLVFGQSYGITLGLKRPDIFIIDC